MKRILKILVVVVCVLGVLAGAAITFTVGWRPFLGPRARALTNRRFESTPQRMVRGQYLVKGVLVCFGCHSEHEWKAPDAAALPGMEGSGEVMPEKGLPGIIVAPNITADRETGAGKWSDDELARAIREGVGHDGRALFPMSALPAFSPNER